MEYQNRHGGYPQFQYNLFTETPPNPSPLSMVYTHLFAIIFCYLAGVYGLKLFFIAPILVLFWKHWNECYNMFVGITQLRVEYHQIKMAVHKNGESLGWLNLIVKHWWSACDKTVTAFVQDWMEPIASKFKLEYVVEYLKILSFNIGPYRPIFSNLRILQKVTKSKSCKDDVNVFFPITLDSLLRPPIISSVDGKSTLAIEVDAILNVPSSDLKMQAKLGGLKQKLLLNVESFDLTGRVQFILNINRRAPFPHISTADVCFLPTPKLSVNCRTLGDKLDVSGTPLLNLIKNKYIEREFQRILVYPKREHIDFTPTPLADSEWSVLKAKGLSEGVLTVKIEPAQYDSAASSSPNNTVKKSAFGIQIMKIKLGSQKCRRRLFPDGWSSVFSFLVHDCNTEKLVAELKSKRKGREKKEIPLASLGFGSEEKRSTDKKVQMSSNGVQLLFTLTYSVLSQVSLISPIPSLNECSLEDSGVLYVHVHGISTYAGKPSHQLYCLVRQGSDALLRTHTVSRNMAGSILWERGIEILVRSCRGLELTFEVLIDCGPLISHDILGLATLRLSMRRSQLIQNHLTIRQFTTPTVSAPPTICVSVVYRNVESVNLTRDSLQEAFLGRTRQESSASCLDLSTKFLNPLNQGYEVTNVEMSSEEGSMDEEGDTGCYGVNETAVGVNYSHMISSGLEQSLLLNTTPSRSTTI